MVATASASAPAAPLCSAPTTSARLKPIGAGSLGCPPPGTIRPGAPAHAVPVAMLSVRQLWILKRDSTLLSSVAPLSHQLFATNERRALHTQLCHLSHRRVTKRVSRTNRVNQALSPTLAHSQGRWPRYGGALTRDCCLRPLVSAFALPAAARQGAADCSGACKARPCVVLRRVQAPLGTAALSWRRCGSTGVASGEAGTSRPSGRGH